MIMKINGVRRAVYRKSRLSTVKKRLWIWGSTVGIEAHRCDIVLTLREQPRPKIHQEYERLKSTDISFTQAENYRWNKVVMLFSNIADRDAVKGMIAKQRTSSDFIDTSAVIAGKKRDYYEQFPKGVSKASALDRLCEILKVKKGCLFAMGDYYNDLEMIKKADISAVPLGTPDDIRQYADYETVRCEDGAVADFIDYLAKKKGMI